MLAIRARILNSIWLAQSLSLSPWISSFGWERWHLSGQCLLLAGLPALCLKAGVFWVEGFGIYQCFTSGLWACVHGWVWAKPKLVSEELVRTPFHLLHLGDWAIITWLPAGQVLGITGNQILHETGWVRLRFFQAGSEADPCHPAERESRLHLTHTGWLTWCGLDHYPPWWEVSSSMFKIMLSLISSRRRKPACEKYHPSGCICI